MTQRLGEQEEQAEALASQDEIFSHNTRTQLKQVFKGIRQLMAPPDPPKRFAGFVMPPAKKDQNESG